MSDLVVTQVKSSIGTKPKHRGTLRALGLGIYAGALGLGTGFGLLLLPIAERSDGAYRILFALTGLGFLVLPLLRRFLKESRAYVQYQTKVTFRQALAAGLGKHFWPLAAMAFLVAAFTKPRRRSISRDHLDG